MSHELENAKDMIYVGETPWHGLGEKVESIDELPGCLDWRVEMRPMSYVDMALNGHISRFQAIIRGDTGDELGVASDRYNPHQNVELWDTFKNFCDAGNMTMETAGTLKGGRIVWLLAKIDKNFTLSNRVDDKQELYALMATAHDLSMQTIARGTAVRVVCWNTLSMALGNLRGDGVFKQSHRSDFNGKRAKDFVANTILGFEQYQAQAEALSAFDVPTVVSEAYAAELVSPEQFFEMPLIDASKEFDQIARAQFLRQVAESDRAASAFRDYMELKSTRPLKQLSADIEIEQNGIAGPTAWGMVNGLTRYVDHNHGRTPDSRLSNAWFGQGNELKRNGLRLAMDYVEALT